MINHRMMVSKKLIFLIMMINNSVPAQLKRATKMLAPHKMQNSKRRKKTRNQRPIREKRNRKRKRSIKRSQANIKRKRSKVK